MDKENKEQLTNYAIDAIVWLLIAFQWMAIIGITFATYLEGR